MWVLDFVFLNVFVRIAIYRDVCLIDLWQVPARLVSYSTFRNMLTAKSGIFHNPRIYSLFTKIEGVCVYAGRWQNCTYFTSWWNCWSWRKWGEDGRGLGTWCGCKGVCWGESGQVALRGSPARRDGKAQKRVLDQCALGQCGTMFIPDTLRSCMVEPDVSTYLQAPSSGQVLTFHNL